MNSRSSVNETNLVNFSTDLSTLNQLDSKDGLLSFPFDHIYACPDNSDRRQTLQLDKEVEISTHCVVAEDNKISTSTSSETSKLKEQLTASENQNKRLKDLLIYHLDLIQQQNELITKRERLYQSLKQENDTLRTRLSKRVTVSQRHNVNPPPLVHVPSCGLPPPPALPPVTSTVVKTEPGPSSQIMLNSFSELLVPNNRTNPFMFDSDLNKTKSYGQGSFELSRGSQDVTSFLQGGLGVPSLLDNNINCENYTMIENKRSYIKKEIKTEPHSDALYTLTPNSGIQRLQRSRRRTSSGIGSLSRMAKSPTAKIEMPENSKVFDNDSKNFANTFSVNKKSKINTYGKSRSAISKRTTQFTGSLSDRLQLIDTTPTGEDPYQLGEADMREQSPIPKLMLQKTNHGRLKICSDGLGESTTSTSRRIYDPAGTENKATNKMKIDRFNLPSTYVHPSDIKKETKTVIVEEPDLDIVKTEPEIDWRMYMPNKTGNATSLCDFSYGENSNNIASHILPSIGAMEFQDIFSPDSTLHMESMNTVVYDPNTDKHPLDKTKKKGIRTPGLIGPNLLPGQAIDNKRISDSKRGGRKRALSATALVKAMKGQNPQKVVIVEPKPKVVKGKAACRGKKSPLPAMVTNKPYHTLVGDPDLSWYLGLDPELKTEDVDPPAENCKLPTVEVPRWREKPYTSCYTLEGTENLDDKVYEKRHQKLEAEERRQLRWHMRRIREQRHVERLRQRQRDPWGGNNSMQPPSVFTIWPQPQRDVRFIEITDTLPVMAFGEILPAVPESDFVLPWVRTSKALKRSKRSKTLH